MSDQILSLTSNWYLAPGKETEGLAALDQLARDVHQKEPDTLLYLVHKPFPVDGSIESLPPARPGLIVFFEVYRNPQSFLRHVNGPVFLQFVAQHGSLFVSSQGHPFTTVEFLTRVAGFIRAAPAAVSDAAVNQHPAVMFEIMANNQSAMEKFYTSVFGWQYQTKSNFAYVHFPERTPPLLGGIGQANNSVPGFEPGNKFYLLVNDLDAAIQLAIAGGGSSYVPPTEVDGYHFAMVKDPEGSVIGLILPFAS